MAFLRAHTSRMIGLFLLALSLAGCDQCGDFMSPSHSQACKSGVPRQ